MAQTEMYPQIVGRRVTTLTSPFTIGGTSTVLNVTDTSVLPTVTSGHPNLVTLSTTVEPVSIATFKYTAMTSTTVTLDSSTPIEMSPSASTFSTGDYVGRPLCKQDWDMMCGNLTDLDTNKVGFSTNSTKKTLTVGEDTNGIFIEV